MLKTQPDKPSIRVRDKGEVTTIGEAVSDPFLLEDEIPGDRVVIQGEPQVEANENTRSAQSFTDLVTYQVPRGQAAFIQSVFLDVASNGEVRVGVAGNEPFRLSGDFQDTIPFGGVVLGGSDQVSISHQSTDGSNATQRAVIIAKEV